MKIDLVYKDNLNVTHNLKYKIGYLSLIKHLALAGQSFLPRVNKLSKTIGFFLLYSDFIELSSFKNSKFSKPNNLLYDPTQQGYFSNIAGKGLADYFAKRICNARNTFNYEAALKFLDLPIEGSRPDLLCVTDSDKFFTVEAKGLQSSSISDSKMDEYKGQSAAGKIIGDFSIASAAYNLYNKVEVKFYDPEQIPLNFETKIKLINGLSHQYYEGVNTFIEEFKYDTVSINKRSYYKIDFKNVKKKYPNNWDYIQHPIIDKMSILLDNDLLHNVEGKYNESDISFRGNKIYIDSDGIGLMKT